MHLGNIYAALMSWLSAKSAGGRWILRIEDLDPQRSKPEHTAAIEEDLLRLGLEWDEGGADGRGPNGPYCQSKRHIYYEEALQKLHATGLTYPCTCTRADIMASSAPHQSDGRIIYGGTCLPAEMPRITDYDLSVKAAVRLHVPDSDITFTDAVYGEQSMNLARDCGDFILRRADGAWAYQLAVVVDDAAMGVTEVVRGNDLLLSAAQQIYLYRLLGKRAPKFAHLPLLCNQQGRRLSKRDSSLSMEYMLAHHTPEEIIGIVAHLAGLQPDNKPCRPTDLLEDFNIAKMRGIAPIITPQ